MALRIPVQKDIGEYEEKIVGKMSLRTVNNQLNAIFNHAERYYGLTDNPVRTGSRRRDGSPCGTATVLRNTSVGRRRTANDGYQREGRAS